MARHLYTTAGTRPRERLEFWRDAVCASYVRVSCEAPDSPSFYGAITLDPIDKVTVSRVEGTEQRVTRGKREIRHSAEEYFLLNLQLTGSCIVKQEDHLADLRVGDWSLYSSTSPYTLILPRRFDQLVIQIPREALLKRLPAADSLTGLRVSGQDRTVSAVSTSLLSLVKCIENSDRTVRSCLDETVIDLVATGLATLCQGEALLSAPGAMALMRARRFIDENLDDPDLSRDRVAAAAGLSVRRLNELFREDNQSITCAIRQARLRRIAADLRDYRYRADSVSAIAYRRGIRNLEYFSQAFRREFGLSPRAYRRQQ